MNTAHYVEKLSAEKKRLEDAMRGVGQRNPRVPGDYEPVSNERGAKADEMEQAEAISSFENNEAILRDLETRYDQILAALDRIEKGKYGVCAIGGEKIEKERLEADPAATTCKKHLK